MNLRTACYIIGNGNRARGHDLITAIAARFIHARKKHPVFAEGKYQALGVIESEIHELAYAIEHETQERVQDELIDVIVTSGRKWLGEDETEAKEKA